MARLLLLSAILLLGVALGRNALDRWIAATELPPLVPETSVEVRGADGKLLHAFAVAEGRWRLGGSRADVDPGYVDLLLAYEDRRFFDHSGVDPRAMLRAAFQALRHGGIVSGASTLTMQVARLLEDSGTGTWRGKLRQMRVALALERELSKDQILTLYMTLAPFGANIEGVRAASLAWFGKEPARLAPSERALLVALPQSPTARRPDRFPDGARMARARVLKRGAEAGLLSDADAGLFGEDPIPDRLHGFPQYAPHIARRIMAANPTGTVHRTSLDTALQPQLEALAQEAAIGIGPFASAAILVVDHQTGLIRASVGSAGLQTDRQGFVDMTQALRSPGSTLKPLIYGRAFHDGLAHPETLIEDAPTAFGAYVPQNFDGQWRGTVTMRKALRASLNIPVVKLAEAIGPAKILATMREAGANPRIPGGAPGLAIALGGLGLTLDDLVTLYSGIAAGGRKVTLGWSQETAATKGNRFLNAAAAWHVADILRGTPPPRHAAPGLAFKTGTSYGFRDAWAIGFDGQYTVGVWLGRPDGTPVPGAFGGDVAAPLLFEVFQRVAPARVPLAPPPPETLIAETAKLPPPLRRFGGVHPAGATGPQIAFPPPDAVLADGLNGVPLKLRGGVPPFSILANEAPVLQGLHRRETSLALGGPGFFRLTVIDARGLAERVSVELR